MRIRRAAQPLSWRATGLAGLVLLLAACAGSPSDGGDPFQGVQYTLGGSAFSAGGAPQIDNGGVLRLASMAVARQDSLGGLVITALDVGDAGTGDLFVLQLHPAAAGTFACAGPGSPPPCHGRIALGMDLINTSLAQTRYEIQSGSVTLDRFDATRVTGTFQVTLVSAGLPAIEIHDGRLNVPMASGDTASAVACFEAGTVGGGC